MTSRPSKGGAKSTHHVVKSTSHVSFDETDKTFRLYAGESIYAFCITPELTLEHLHWGPKLPPGYDLRYLSQSSRLTHFATVEAAPDKFGGKIVLAADTLEEVQKTWKENRRWVPTEMSDLERFQRRRIENFSWRVMSKVLQARTKLRRLKALLAAVTTAPETSSASPYDHKDLAAKSFSATRAPPAELFDRPRRPTRRGSVDVLPSLEKEVMKEQQSLAAAAAAAAKNIAEQPSDASVTASAALESAIRSAAEEKKAKQMRRSSMSAVPSGSQSLAQSPLRFGPTRKGLHYVPSESDIERLRMIDEDTLDENLGKSPKHRILKTMDDLAASTDDDLSFRRQTDGGAASQGSVASRRRTVAHTFDRALGKLGKGSLCVEYSDHGTGDFRAASFLVVDNFNGSAISPLRYRKHRIYSGKLPMPDPLPGIRCEGSSEASTLVVTMADAVTGLEVDLVYVCMHNYDVITRRTVFRNADQRELPSGDKCLSSKPKKYGSSKVLLKASSMSVDLEAEPQPFYLVHLAGGWGRERFVEKSKLSQGTLSFGSIRGVSSHEHSPFAALTMGHPSETTGEVHAFSLIYSGNFQFEFEQGELGRLRVNIGIDPMGLQWELQQGTSFSTPEVVMVRSSQGLGGMSRTFHRLFLDRLIPRTWADDESLVVLNTWESRLLNVGHNSVLELAEMAHRVGVNLVVLDDGWIVRGERGEYLGDWFADKVKFPQGLDGIARAINRLGCRFGLWIAPEVITQNSAVSIAHPDWYLHVPGRVRCADSDTLILDLSRADVREHLFKVVSRVLNSANIEYLKWDMSVPFVEPYSVAASKEGRWQTETAHRYVLGLYDLQRRITEAFPTVLLENCSAGGGRFDPGMLYFSPQMCCSDNTDALLRMKIQYGSSLLFPARCLGAHVTASPNLLTGNTTKLRTRGFVALCGTFGIELDVRRLNIKELRIMKRLVELYIELAPLIRWGDMYRLWNPFESNLAAWMFVSRDKGRAVVFAFSVNSNHWSSLVPRMSLQGLDSESDYEVTEPMPNNIAQAQGSLMLIETEVPVYQLATNSVVLRGSILMTAGLPLKFYSLDDSIIFELRRVECFSNQNECMLPQEESAALPEVVMGVDENEWL